MIQKQGNQFIKIRGAAENNLKDLNVDIPRNEFVVLTGLSGSGKSSLAFDTIYAEGQRRYMESLSSYARQFLGQMEKPNVESIEGLPPAISIDQKSTNRNPRSTVGTVTEIYDYFRLLYARVGIPHCPKCGREISRQTVDQMVDKILSLPERTKIQLLSLIHISGRLWIRWWIRSSHCLSGPRSSCWRRWCAAARGVMKRFWSRRSGAALSV